MNEPMGDKEVQEIHEEITRLAQVKAKSRSETSLFIYETFIVKDMTDCYQAVEIYSYHKLTRAFTHYFVNNCLAVHKWYNVFIIVSTKNADRACGREQVAAKNSIVADGTLGDPDLPSEQKPAITIADATYLYTQKSSNYLLQTVADLIVFACGTYQIKQARSYVGKHFRFHGIYTLEVSRDQIPGLQGINPMLLRANIKSRHSSGKTYCLFIVTEVGNRGREPIISYYCNCIVGLRTVGCCSHVMSIIWHLGYARHEGVTRPANFLDDKAKGWTIIKVRSQEPMDADNGKSVFLTTFEANSNCERLLVDDARILVILRETLKPLEDAPTNKLKS
ncbi:unnamed protein product [Leptidea sinapis]|uniref:SWIM-type domain-containing protein n=1 Tax=Leptidea sinapis TaxID=189913 RepID=A0A5E4R666_9NEOP|nr:unnamed protein product [Leptidea sinapis]